MSAAFLLSAIGTEVPAAYAAPLSCKLAPVNPGAVPPRPSFSGISAASATNIWAVGLHVANTLEALYPLTDHWDGTRWTAVAAPNVAGGPSGLDGVATRTPTDVWAVGFSGITKTLIEHWDGSAWSIVPSPKLQGGIGGRTSLQSVASFAANEAYAVGLAEDQQSNYHPLIERWDGSAWSVVPALGPALAFYRTVNGSSDHDIWAVGATGGFKGPLQQALSLHFNGQQWQPVAVPVPAGATDTNLQGVVALAPNNAWAVGSSSKDGGRHYHTLTEHWNGRAWTIVPSPNAPYQTQELLSVSAGSPTDIWAVGDDSVGRPIAMHWNGTAWQLIDTGSMFANGTVFVGVTSVGAKIWVAGYNVNQPKPPPFAQGGCF